MTSVFSSYTLIFVSLGFFILGLLSEIRIHYNMLWPSTLGDLSRLAHRALTWLPLSPKLLLTGEAVIPVCALCGVILESLLHKLCSPSKCVSTCFGHLSFSFLSLPPSKGRPESVNGIVVIYPCLLLPARHMDSVTNDPKHGTKCEQGQ